VVLGALHLHGRAGDGGEGQLLQVVEDVLVEAGVDLPQASRAQALGAVVQLDEPEGGGEGGHGLDDERHVRVLLKPGRETEMNRNALLPVAVRSG